MHLSMQLRHDRLAAAEARRFVAEGLDVRASMADEDAEALLLLVSEIVTNAVLHTPGPARLEVRLEDGQLWVGVTDPDPTCPSPTRPDGDQVGGLGLWLLEQLATDWGMTPHGAGRGKTVWFTLPARVPARRRRPDSRRPSAGAHG